jgi:dTDP-4-amino-4,6-dideoxygalactose transaminase
VYESLRAANILVNLHYIPVYRQPYFEQMGFSKGYCTEAERYYSEVISLPIYSGLYEEQQNQIMDALRKATNV